MHDSCACREVVIVAEKEKEQMDAEVRSAVRNSRAAFDVLPQITRAGVQLPGSDV